MHPARDLPRLNRGLLTSGNGATGARQHAPDPLHDTPRRDGGAMIGWAVRQLVIWGGVALVLFIVGSRLAPPPSATAPAPAASSAPAARGAVPNALVFRANSQGHVLVDAYVNGAPVRLL